MEKIGNDTCGGGERRLVRVGIERHSVGEAAFAHLPNDFTTDRRVELCP